MKKRGHLHRHLNTKYIELNTRRCQACWKCVEACPNHVLGKAILFRHRHAHVDDADACKGCKKCVRVCENGAIIYREDGKLHKEATNVKSDDRRPLSPL
jgi:NAD-dependent dihydropyrimidine dehydrogenase PreA subunit